MIRKSKLQPLIDYILGKLKSRENVNLTFICTHNSRRSHLAQIWAQVAAYHYGFSNVYCYSGGTEATAVYPEIIKTIKGQDLEVTSISKEINPVYAIKSKSDAPPIIAFSKKYDHPFNPSSGFGAIMTCSEADENCPIIFGAKVRIPLTYDDPKISDGTEDQANVYLERSEQIKAEMFYVFKKVNDELQK